MSFMANAYAYAFTNDDAPAYAREWLTANPEAGEGDISDWAHETADGIGAVVYTGQAIALYATGLFDDEDEDLADMALDNNDASLRLGAGERIADACMALSYTWHRRVLEEAALVVLASFAAAAS
jgi:hypothetical protein